MNKSPEKPDAPKKPEKKPEKKQEQVGWYSCPFCGFKDSMPLTGHSCWQGGGK